MIGTTVGSYRVTAKVSVGGMGTVYKAEHSLIGKLAAVKVLHPELRGNREVVQRFFNEAKATTQIKHPGIVEIFDFGYLPSGDGFIVMEFLEGVSLARRLKKFPKMPEGEAMVLMRSVCSALAAAHAKGIVHRDLKPDNIFLCPDSDAPTGERPKILDFGIAKLNVGLTGPGNATKTGAVMGTPTYMSPEQCRGTGEVDHRADLYSIGCMVYEMVAGRPPFDDMGPGELLGAHLFMQPQKPTSYGAELSEAAEQLIMSLLEKNPAQRQPQTAVELARRFGELAQGHGLVTRMTPTPTLDYGPDDDEPAPSSVSSRPEVSAAAGVAPTMPSTPGLNASTSSQPEPEVTVASQPTTLSGAASQSVLRNKGSRVGLAIGGVIALLIAGGAVMFAMNGNETKPAAQPTSGPENSAAPAPVAAPTPAPTPPVEVKPTPTPPPVETAPTPTPPPVETAQTPAETTTSTQVKGTHTKKPKPTTTKPVTTKPATTTTPKPTTTEKPKPTTTEKPKPGTGSGSSILIETDI